MKGWGPKSSICPSIEAQGDQTFWRDVPGFLAGYPGVAPKEAPAISRLKLAKSSAKLVANFRRSLEGDFRASSAGKIVRSIFHQNSTYEVLGCGGPYTKFEKIKFVFDFGPLFFCRYFPCIFFDCENGKCRRKTASKNCTKTFQHSTMIQSRMPTRCSCKHVQIAHATSEKDLE